MANLLLFNKPFQVLSQFTDSQGRQTLANYIPVGGVYPAGRLDYDSEGLLLLTDDGGLQARIAQPRHKMRKCYRVQVEGEPNNTALNALRTGIILKDGPARALQARIISSPKLWPRDPPVRYRKTTPTHWLELHIDEGRNRQVRRMTAAVGLPTLRLVRWQIGPWALDDLPPGSYRAITIHNSSPGRNPGAHHARRQGPKNRRTTAGKHPRRR